MRTTVIQPSRRSVLRALALAAAVPLGLPAMAKDPAKAKDKDKVSLLYLPVTDYAPFFVAKEKGYFDAFDVDLELLPKDATAETVPLVASGRVTVGGASWSAGVFNAAAAGSGVAAVADFARVPTSGRSSVHFMLSPALAAQGVVSSAALKGKRIGVLGAGAFTEYFAATVLKTGGLTLGDVEIVHLTVPTIAQAFANGAIDASVVFEPFATLFEEKSIATILPGDFARGVDLGFILVNSDFLKAKEDVVVRLVAGFLRAARDLQSGGWQDPATRDIIRKYVKLDTSVMARMGLSFLEENGVIDLASVREQEAFFRQAGQLSYKAPLDFASFYRPDVAAKAVALLAK
jgi:NitT/TauT family transport system substrate-binding protein